MRLRGLRKRTNGSSGSGSGSFMSKWLWLGGIVIGLPLLTLVSNGLNATDVLLEGMAVFELSETSPSPQTPQMTLIPPGQEPFRHDEFTRDAQRLVEDKDTPSPTTAPPTRRPTVSPTSKPTTKTVDSESQTSTTTSAAATTDDERDKDCIFRDSPIYRKVYVYPTYGDPDLWKGDILSTAGQNLTALPRWPWLALDEQSRKDSTGHYNVKSQNVQYTTELLVREVITNPASCLRTNNPEEATLFYVPYLPSVEHHMGHDRKTDYATSPYGAAIMDIIDKEDYTQWENTFGLTSKYWKRRQGADHILVFSEPMHGLYHPRNRRGNFHFIHSQKQLKPPIVISVELSTTFVEQYPSCAAKNILMPYPNTDGNWFNGVYARQAQALVDEKGIVTSNSTAALATERALAATINTTTFLSNPTSPRPIAQFYAAGKHGTCRVLRGAMTWDYKSCAASYSMLKEGLAATHYGLGMRVSTFCPCPGGDSPSAKRHFDAIVANCIPIILSYDFVWPFTTEFDPTLDWKPEEFALRLKAQDYDKQLLDPKTCKPTDESRPGLQAYLESIPAEEIQRLRKGMEKARHMYSWYAPREDLVENPLREGVLPDGGTAHTLVKLLAERAEGVRWPACAEELKKPQEPDAKQFKC